MNSEKTMMLRKTPSAPMRWVSDNLDYSYSDWNVLHFGEGKAFPDSAEMARMGFAVTSYDPNSMHSTVRDPEVIDPSLHIYDIGFSFYVFNTLLPATRAYAFDQMQSCCKRCIIAVRTDKVNGTPVLGYDGVTTKRGTFQTQLDTGAWMEWFKRVSPEGTSVSLLHNGGHFCIIEVSR